jgi:hypothetical protein
MMNNSGILQGVCQRKVRLKEVNKLINFGNLSDSIQFVSPHLYTLLLEDDL